MLAWPSVGCWSQTSTPVEGPASKGVVKLPLEARSVRFAVIGDSGTGDRAQYEVAQEMKAFYDKIKFDFVIMLGDNIYGSHTAKDFENKFETPYKPLLDEGVEFYASLGNHDDPNQEPLYKPFNMNGQRYYSFKRGDVEFFVLDSNYMDPVQLNWIDQSLGQSKAKWKICYFHHPLFSNGKHHGSDVDLRARLLPIFERYGVNVVFSGHEHVYERMKPQDNIYFFVLGNSAQLMTHDFHTTKDMEKSFDSDRGFMVVEISGDEMYYQTIARGGETIDAGSMERQGAAAK
jgi:3',5'-cyclic AMP phosphodiesterase CpdA